MRYMFHYEVVSGKEKVVLPFFSLVGWNGEWKIDKKKELQRSTKPHID